MVVALKALDDGRTEMTFEQRGLMTPEDYTRARSGWMVFFERIDERVCG